MRIIFIILSLLSLTCYGQIPVRIKAGSYTPPYIPPTPIPGNTGAFTFTLGSQLRTSAGVFRDDSILVKTLWNDEQISAGSYTRYWDGTDDYGNVIPSPDANYKVKVLSNNVQYEWEGTIGNTSDSMTGTFKMRGYYHCMRDLAFTNTYGYYCTGYSEGTPARAKFDITKPNQKIVWSNSTTDKADVNYVATDGTYVYWGCFDSNANSNSWVLGSSCSTDADTTFSSGVPYTVKFGKTYTSVISSVNSVNSNITGLTVQKTGNYLFVARAGLNQLQVLNKATGALVQTLTYTTPKGLSVDGGDNLWMVSNNTAAKYTVNIDGTLTLILTLSGLIAPHDTQVSTSGTEVAILDTAIASQQVKFYNNTTGAATTTLGTPGGYSNDATVTNNKFYFNDVNGPTGNKLPFITYQPDGSFWVGDPGNLRAQHYSSGKSYIGRIMSLGATYNVWPDKNNITRLFSGCLEFSIDYSQPLSGTSGWALVKNWGANYPTNTNTKYGFTTPITFSNGRTYAVWIRSDFNTEIIELGADNKLRFTGKLTSNYSKRILCTDGSRQDYTVSGGVATYKRYPLTGFDGSGNPLWSSTGETLAIANTNAVIGNPVVAPNTQIFSTTNKILLYNYKTWSNNTGPIYSTGYHLGLMQLGSNNNYLFQTEKSTHRNYAGPYPGAGWYDCGNMVNDFGGGAANIVDRYILTSYHGEFWKNSQTNKFNFYLDNGLAIGQFGTTRPEVGFTNHAAAEMAGNALIPIMVKDSATGNMYVYHGDESDHSAFHRWKITGLNTIAEQVINVPFPSAYVAPVLSYTDLMAGLPFNETLDNNTAGWTRSPAQDTTNWSALTSKQSYDSLTENDVTINARITTSATYKVERDLGTNNVTNNWKITGQIAYPSQNLNNFYWWKQYLEVLDADGKVLVTFYPTLNSAATFASMYANTVQFATTAGYYITAIGQNLTPFEVKIESGVVTFTYGDYTPIVTTILDGTGNWQTPKTLRVRFINSTPGSSSSGQGITVKDFKFYKDY